MNRLNLYKNVSNELWENWQWQMQNSLNHYGDIRVVFPNLPEEELNLFKQYTKKYKFRMTPYLLSLIELDEQGNPMKNDPIWNQFCYLHEENNQDSYEDDDADENWENSAEMPTRILQHKYPDRAIVRITSTCFGHCNYCYLTSRVLDLKTTKAKASTSDEWEKSLIYLRQNPQIRDVLISGGDPLILSNERIEKLLKDLRDIPSIQTIRLNTRVFTFNPYRFDEALVRIFKTYDLTALEIHMCHSNELTNVVDERLELMDKVGHRPLILWRAPLLSGINSTEEALETLFVNLYRRRITPYYLFHYAPFTLGRKKQGVSLREGSKMMRSLRRHVPGPAFPTFTLFHIEGKHDVPLDEEGTLTFRYEEESGKKIAKFRNWKGNDVSYPDVEG